MNTELLTRVRDYIADEEHLVDMGYWFADPEQADWEDSYSDGELIDSLANDGDPIGCGTSMCIGGTTLFLHYEGDPLKIKVAATESNFEFAATALLGVSPKLFYTNQWPKDIQDDMYSGRYTERDSMLRMIDLTLAGLV